MSDQDRLVILDALRRSIRQPADEEDLELFIAILREKGFEISLCKSLGVAG